jgi:hypothetical protein
MRLRHATPVRNLSSIQARGLLTEMSRGVLPAVWFHSAFATVWAVPHTSRRHGVPVTGVALLEVEVPRSWLRRGRRGLWICFRDIPPDRIVFPAVAVSA